MAKRKKMKTVTIKLNRDGTVTYRSTGGFNLRKLFTPSELPCGTAPERSAEAGKQAGAQ
jgi:hypothetical protein